MLQSTDAPRLKVEMCRGLCANQGSWHDHRQHFHVSTRVRAMGSWDFRKAESGVSYLRNARSPYVSDPSNFVDE